MKFKQFKIRIYCGLMVFTILLSLFTMVNDAVAADSLKIRGKVTNSKHSPPRSDLKYILKLLKVYVDTGRYIEAKELSDRAFKLNQNSSELYSLSSKLLLKLYNYNQAEIMANKALELDTQDTTAYITLGICNLYKYSLLSIPDEKILNEAHKNFIAASYINDYLPDAKLGIAAYYRYKGEKDKAINYLLEAKELDVTNPDTYFYLGDFYRCEGFFEKAVEYLEKSVKYSYFLDTKVYLYLASLYKKLADVEKAKELYNKIIEVYPDNKEAQKQLEMLEKLYL